MGTQFARYTRLKVDGGVQRVHGRDLGCVTVESSVNYCVASAILVATNPDHQPDYEQCTALICRDGKPVTTKEE